MLPKVKNTLSIEKLFGYRFLILDTKDMLWLRAGSEAGISIHVEQVWEKKNFNYLLKFIAIRKKDLSAFEKLSDKVANKMLLCGHSDYEKCCKEIEAFIASHSAQEAYYT